MVKSKYQKKANKNSNNKTLIYLGFAIVGVLLVGVISYNLGSKSSGTGGSGAAAVIGNGKQVVNIKASAAGYEPNVINVKKGIPVVMNVDVTADAGCVGGIIIKDYGVNKALTLGAKGTVEFTPDKVGTSEFSCQMYMSTGKINVTA